LSGIVETDLVVCRAELKRDHPELFHYTKRGGFEGILGTDTLRASHFADMNDKHEVWLLKERLIPALAPRFEALAEGLDLYRRVMFMKGGRGAGGARRMFEALYDASFAAVRRSSKIAAFMTSFSTHAADGDFERANGLWSQWDRYAGPDGYCIVFDTAAMCDLLGAEFDGAYWIRLAVEPVRYSGPDVPVERLMPELMHAGEDVFRQFMDGRSLQEFAVPEFLEGATLLKDAQWREEREVRIVAIPGTKKLMVRGLRTYPGRFKRMPIAEIEKRDDGVRFLTLFGERKVRLPIKRIIVGPAAGAEERVALARKLRPDLPVTISRCAPPVARRC
jgi:hypothetical protein